LGNNPVFTTVDKKLVSAPGVTLKLSGIPLHEPRGRNYYVAFLDTGAYQDMLRMNHNRIEVPREIIIE
jgi:arginine decarboxylase